MKKMGHPYSEKSDESWQETIYNMVENFEIMQEERYLQEAIDHDDRKFGRLNEEESEKFRIAVKKQEEHNEKTLQQFIKNYFDLWD